MSATANRILDAAESVARREGLPAVTVRVVAEEAQVAVGTLRHHFPRQRDLHDAVVRRLMDTQLTDGDIADPHRPAADRLSDRMAQFLPPDQERVGELVAWVGLIAAAVGPDARPGTDRFLAVLEAASRQRVQSWLGHLVTEELLAPQDVEDLATVLGSLVSGLCLTLMTPDAGVSVAQAHHLLRRTVHRLLPAPRGAGPEVVLGGTP